LNTKINELEYGSKEQTLYKYLLAQKGDYYGPVFYDDVGFGGVEFMMEEMAPVPMARMMPMAMAMDMPM
jgi:hypothetical protein